MNVTKTYSGVIKKEEKIKKICADFKVTPNEIAYIGDDVNDIGLLNLVGLSATPNDGNFKVKKIVDYVCKKNSGTGVLREIADNILLTKITKDFPDTRFVRVCGNTTARLPELDAIKNMTHEDLDTFVMRINNQKDL